MDTHSNLQPPFTLAYIPETSSTISYLKSLHQAGNAHEYTVAATDYQTAGRGQRGNTWEAERGKNLLFSLLLEPAFLAANKQFLLSQAVSLAIKEELEHYANGFSIKWPNDIYWREKKICGMLIEHDLQGNHLLLTSAGIGINVNQSRFSPGLPNPVSLSQITGKAHDRLPLLQAILDRLLKYYRMLQGGDIACITERYEEALFRKGIMAPFADGQGTFMGQITGVRSNGMLAVKDSTGKERLYAFKEVSYVL